MEQKIIVNGVEFVKVSPRSVEQIEAGCRQYRAEYVFGTAISVAGLMIKQVQRLFGPSRECKIN